MAHGVKPYGRTSPLERVFAVQDMAELAARLGSPDTFDRRGNILFMDGFEAGINKWIGGGFGVGAALAWSGAEARSGGFSALLTSGTGANPYYWMDHHEPYPVLSNFGTEFSICIDANCTAVWLRLSVYDGALNTEYLVAYDAVAGQAQYRDALLVFQNLGPLGLQPQRTLFHTIKMIVDGAAGQYRYLLIDSNVYDLRGIAAWVGPVVTNPHAQIRIYNHGALATSSSAYVDDVLFTQNEP